MARWTTITLLAAAVLLIVGAVVLAPTLIVPRLVTPRIVSSLDAVEATCTCDTGFDRVTYGWARGLVIRSFTAERSSAPGEGQPTFDVEIDSVAVAIGPLQGLRLLRSMDSLALPSGTVPRDPRDLAPWLAPTLNSLDQSRLSLPAVSVFGVDAMVSIDGQRGIMSDGEASMAARSPDSPLAVDGAGRVRIERAFRPVIDARGAGALIVTPENASIDVTVSSAAIDLGDAFQADAETAMSLRLAPGEPYAYSIDFSLSDGAINAPSLATDPITGLAVDYDAAGTFDPSVSSGPVYTAGGAAAERYVARGLLTTERGELTLNGITLELRPRLLGIVRETDSGPEGPVQLQREPTSETVRELLSVDRYLDVVLRLPPTPAEAIRASLPEPILGPLADARMRGTVGWSLDLHVPLHQVSRMSWTAEVPRQGFGVDQLSWDTNVYKLNGGFVASVTDPLVEYDRDILIPAMRLPALEWTSDLSEFRVSSVRRWREADAELASLVAASPPRIVDGATTGQGAETDSTYRYVRLEDMSKWVPRAILTAEDGDFFYYHGVNFYTLPRALERNLIAGEIQFGASTISMQLVKMLFLDAGRVVARKLQEVFLVHLMESVVPVSKERILEMYINLAEFGPRVYGIADAAWYYFRKSPAALSAGEAVWLASILPSPKRYHQYYEAGAISPGWFERMKGYFTIMLERERMSPQEYADAILAAPAFAYAATGATE